MTTTYTKQQARALCAQCMKANSLAEAASILESEAENLLAEIIARDIRTEKTGELAGIDWVRYLRKLAGGLRVGRAVFSVFAKGNSKLPFYSYSELPEFTCPGAGDCLKFCYSFTAWRYPAAFMRQLQNTLFMRFKRSVIAEAFRLIPLAEGKGGVTLRLYVDGDFRDMTTLAFWMSMLKQRPEVQCYGYSKSWELFESWHKQGLSFPSNYTLNLSSGSRYSTNRDLIRVVKSLACTRGEFVAVKAPGKFAKGFARFQDKAYHAAVRTAGRVFAASPRVFSCPGKCGSCLPNGEHACGQRGFAVTIAIAEHN